MLFLPNCFPTLGTVLSDDPQTALKTFKTQTKNLSLKTKNGGNYPTNPWGKS